MTSFNMIMNDDDFKIIVIDLLIDILASNQDIIRKINSINPNYSSDEETNQSRVLILEYLQSKYGDIPKELSDFLKTKGIDKNDKL